MFKLFHHDAKDQLTWSGRQIVEETDDAQRFDVQSRFLSILLKARQMEEALQLTETLIAQTPDAGDTVKNWREVEHYTYACVYSVASWELPEHQEEYAARGMQLLRQAADMGFNSREGVEHMRQDADLDPLRERSDFQELMTSLEKNLNLTPQSPSLDGEETETFFRSDRVFVRIQRVIRYSALVVRIKRSFPMTAGEAMI